MRKKHGLWIIFVATTPLPVWSGVKSADKQSDLDGRLGGVEPVAAGIDIDA